MKFFIFKQQPFYFLKNIKSGKDEEKQNFKISHFLSVISILRDDQARNKIAVTCKKEIHPKVSKN